MHQGPAYFGDLDESDGKLLEFEKVAEEEGVFRVDSITYKALTICDDAKSSDWEEAYANLKAALGLPTESLTPKLPRQNSEVLRHSANSTSVTPPNQAKRKALDEDNDAGMSDPIEESVKRSKKHSSAVALPSDGTSDPQMEHARAAAAFIPFLTPENLLPPKLPTREEMEGVLLNLRKQALVEEYFM